MSQKKLKGSPTGFSKTGKQFVPLLFAGDINVYSVARAFHEAYGVVSNVFGKYATGPCCNSTIINYTVNPKIEESDEFLQVVRNFAQSHKDSTILLIGCGDSYVELASRHKNNFPSNVLAPVIDIDLMHALISKERFYQLCEESAVDYPDTFIHYMDMGSDFDLPFDGPFIVKPSNGIEYWRHPYLTQKKVYKVDTRKELEDVLEDIYGSGYREAVVIQNFIPGDDTFMRVLTSYSGKDGKVGMMCLGHVLLEEHTPHGIGNHAVIITEFEKDLMEKYRLLLDGLHYVGFSNFDIKYDMRDGKYKAFEINTRQGRSNYYVTGAGANIARCLVSDYLDDEPMDLKLVESESLWMVVPQKVAFRYIRPKEYKLRMKELIRNGKCVNPLYYSEDKGFKKRFILAKSQMGHFIKYRKYLGKR